MKKLSLMFILALFIACSGSEVSEQSWIPDTDDRGSLPRTYAGYTLRSSAPEGSVQMDNGQRIFRDDNGLYPIEVFSYDGKICSIKQSVPVEGKPKKEVVFKEAIKRFGEPVMRRGIQVAFNADSTVLSIGVAGDDYVVILTDVALEMSSRRKHSDR